MFGSYFMKLAIALLLFVVLPILMMRFLVHKTIQVVHPPEH